mmetsp:Transcript_32277/g.67622  ORF Transcript_32277/g.67622 Transcript_32277/m.67622 type:complete len:131 (+) Transcript_32277:240-632(+)
MQVSMQRMSKWCPRSTSSSENEKIHHRVCTTECLRGRPLDGIGLRRIADAAMTTLTPIGYKEATPRELRFIYHSNSHQGVGHRTLQMWRTKFPSCVEQDIATLHRVVKSKNVPRLCLVHSSVLKLSSIGT